MSSSAPARRRLALLGVAGLLVAAAGALAAFPLSDAEWFVLTSEGGLLTSGRSITNGLTSTIPTAVLAALALTLVFGPRGKRVVGMIVAAMGAGMTVLCLGAVPPDDFGTTVARSAGGAVRRTSAAGYYLVAAAAVLLGGLLLAWQPGDRATRTPRQESQWAVLDRGDDPTIG